MKIEIKVKKKPVVDSNVIAFGQVKLGNDFVIDGFRICKTPQPSLDRLYNVLEAGYYSKKGDGLYHKYYGPNDTQKAKEWWRNNITNRMINMVGALDVPDTNTIVDTIEVEDINFRNIKAGVVDMNGKLEPVKAMGKIVIDDIFVIDSIKLFKGENGLFVKLPSRQAGVDMNGKDKYVDYAYPMDGDLRRYLNSVVIGSYERGNGLLETNSYIEIEKEVAKYVVNNGCSIVTSDSGITKILRTENEVDACASKLYVSKADAERLTADDRTPTKQKVDYER